MKPFIFGCSGKTLTPEEMEFFAEADPLGFILFQRNCAAPQQVKDLVGALRDSVGWDAPIFIDQEGGRVTRLKPPHWRAMPPLHAIGEVFEKNMNDGIEAIILHTRLTAHMLTDLGINGNCSPMLDLWFEGASDVMGDRTISHDPRTVAVLGRIAVETFLACGVFPVIKHLPGHGRVKTDPHHVLPIVEEKLAVLEAEDFKPFIAMQDAPFGMSAHVLYTAIDPDLPASLSHKVHQSVIRGTLGFQGFLIMDDLNMKALSGTLGDLAKQALEAGADAVLHCCGSLPEMKVISGLLPEMRAQSLKRLERAYAMLGTPIQNYDFAKDSSRLDELIQRCETASHDPTGDGVR